MVVFAANNGLEDNFYWTNSGPAEYNPDESAKEISQDGIFAQDTAEERRSHIADHFFIQH